MQLNITTDYAIRIVLYLGQCTQTASAAQIAEDMCIPRGYLEKILRKLKKESYISADLGAKGGYRLNKGLEDITLGELIRLMENTVKMNRCLEKDEYCSRGAQKICRIRRYYGKVQDELEKRVFNISLKAILELESSGNEKIEGEQYDEDEVQS